MSNSILCESINTKLDAFYDNELSAAERTEVVAHIGTCPACAKRLADIDAVKSSLQSLPLLTPKIDVAANFEQILAQRTSKQKVLRLPAIWGGIGVAAAAAVAIFVGHGLINPNPSGVVAVIPHSVNHQSIASQPRKMTNDLPANLNQQKEKTAANIEKPELANAAIKMKYTMHDSSKPKLKVQEIADNGDAANSSRQVEPNKNAREESLIAANQAGITKTGSGRSSIDGSGSDEIAFNPPQQTLGAGAIVGINSAASHIGHNKNLVAVYDAEQNNTSEELGIATDEDGLYAIKL